MTPRELAEKILSELITYVPILEIGNKPTGEAIALEKIESLLTEALEEAKMDGCLEHSKLFEQAAMKNKSLFEQINLFKQQAKEAKSAAYEECAKIVSNLRCIQGCSEYDHAIDCPYDNPSELIRLRAREGK